MRRALGPLLGNGPSQRHLHRPRLRHHLPLPPPGRRSNGLSASYDQRFTTLPEAPQIEAEQATAVHADFARIAAEINPGGGESEFHTHYHVAYVTQAHFEAEEFAGAQATPSLDAGSARTFQAVIAQLTGLAPNTTYRYRLVAENASSPPGGNLGPVHAFTTLPFFEALNDPCPNAHVRQQSGASLLLDCRAYELVSAAHAGGYDVASSLIEGQIPPALLSRSRKGASSTASTAAASPAPANRPTAASTPTSPPAAKKAGAPATSASPPTGPLRTAPFSSALLQADAGLHTFAFGGPELCSPCFARRLETGIPLRLPDGELVQGMAGPAPEPDAHPDGYVAKHLSADGTHLLFGSTSPLCRRQRRQGDVSIYDRNLSTGETHVVSNTRRRRLPTCSPASRAATATPPATATGSPRSTSPSDGSPS